MIGAVIAAAMVDSFILEGVTTRKVDRKVVFESGV